MITSQVNSGHLELEGKRCEEGLGHAVHIILILHLPILGYARVKIMLKANCCIGS